MSFNDEYPDFVLSSQPDTFEITTHFFAIIGITLMSIFFGIKIYNIRCKNLSYSKWLVVLLYISSWAFIVSNDFAGITNNANRASCISGDYICVILYSISKLLIYLWLVERVWVVKTEHVTRWKSKTYRFLISILVPYIIGFLFLVIYFTQDGKCYIVIDLVTAVCTTVYDSIINFTLSMTFVRTLFKVIKHKITVNRASNLKRLAYRSLIASLISLIASIANLLAFTIVRAERGTICFMICDFDIMLNVVVIHWVTSPRSLSTSTTTLQSKDIISINIASVNNNTIKSNSPNLSSPLINNGYHQPTVQHNQNEL